MKPNARPEWVKQDTGKDLSCFITRTGMSAVLLPDTTEKKNCRCSAVFSANRSGLNFRENSVADSFSVIPGSRQAVVKISASDTPPDYYQFDLDQGANARLNKITALNQSPVKTLGKSYDLLYKSFDGMQIHGIIYAKEDWVKGNKKYPVIVWPHGGPDAQEIHRYDAGFQYFVAKGFIVFAPNFRGSTGYGKKFETLNDKDWGGGHIKDYPDEFKGAVAVVALANLFTLMSSIPQDPAWQGEFRTEIGDPVKDEALYRERSPFFHVSKVRTPLKIYQAGKRHPHG
ncbi:hypothetical protein CHS0354_002088 [Potamilus streckersoni]|uniref:Peptidase S9 prolyl oligopeptidase catalytic domain-containing protein n=1 Tax=Potamilus streckersoni TaxID=2493646 RepID=A0AAE0T5L4_9BIVA|nr:hypothetical protein CHS0354_002088 [Potamilus streckersoni]